MEHNENNKSLGYKVGTAFGTIIFGCVAALLIAVTVKIIFWMF